ncbi:MbnP family protein [Myxococcus vastator]|uniref:MbnP family protein n=1 Tax=Myxococcus vastator TaxID=2709664 RepID=UPI0013D3B56F|nr:MbnP family protein [Myxococcus vastator]
MKKHAFLSLPTLGRMLALTTVALLALPACGDDGATDEQLQASEDQRRQLEQQVAELEAEVTRLEAQVAQQQQDSEAAQAELADITLQLDEARELLASQDWEGVYQQLTQVRAELAALRAQLAATDGSLELNAAFVFGTSPFALGQTYTTAGGDTVTFSQVRYWLSNVTLLKQDGTTTALADSYHLMEVINAQELEGTSNPVTLPANRRERVQARAVPAGSYTGIRFSIGVDPSYNDDLSRQAGELHVLQNMASVSWMWFTSYIFTKTHGTYVTAEGTQGDFTWDTGTNANYRTVELPFPAAVTVNSQQHVAVNVQANVAALFTALSPRTTLSIGATQSAESATLSDNFAGMFSVVSVENSDR